VYFVQLRIAKVNTKDTDNFLQHLAAAKEMLRRQRPERARWKASCGFSGVSKGLTEMTVARGVPSL
ncbi:MAG: hypothetical protein MZW92_27110, partial [Comamonadaceae bacterium]|nr:hypothetical protein [Comamonadaceae bacterium]